MDMFICPPIVHEYGSTACLKILNDKGIELSLSFDNNCGKSSNLKRTQMCLFNNEDSIGENKLNVTPEVFLETLASHLGYKIERSI